ncbi:hypothetical protein KW803_01165 [Candidatus Saccharibacteria bacterium]|nr:hypothetical protein [Candidatus Saccharibacteria bacterium]
MIFRKHKLSFWLAILSFLGLVGLMVGTNPAQKITYAVAFFALALIFMISFGFLMVGLQLGEVSSKNRYRIIAVSLIILTILMFRSAQSLNWVDGIILLLISFGLVFYISRRS